MVFYEKQEINIDKIGNILSFSFYENENQIAQRHYCLLRSQRGVAYNIRKNRFERWKLCWPSSKGWWLYGR